MHHSHGLRLSLYIIPAEQETSSFRQGLPESRSHGGQLVAEQVFDSGNLQPTVSHPCGLDSGNPCWNDGSPTLVYNDERRSVGTIKCLTPVAPQKWSV